MEPLPKKSNNERYEICKQCDLFRETSKTCKLCGCFMKLKTQFKGSSCPIKKW